MILIYIEKTNSALRILLKVLESFLQYDAEFKNDLFIK